MLLMCLDAAVSAAEPIAQGATPAPTRQQLVGTWRLLSIEFCGPDGPVADPFYQSGSIGLIVYDPSGWMSVQIAAPDRPASNVPASRTHRAAGTEASLKALAFDSYYAYFGLWSYDAAESAVTHHVLSSLLPAEIGMDYRQEITLEGDRLIFTGRDPNHGKPTVRRKIWQRVSSAVE